MAATEVVAVYARSMVLGSLVSRFLVAGSALIVTGLHGQRHLLRPQLPR